MSSRHLQNANAATHKQLIQWINDAGMSEGAKKVNLLRKIIEVLLHQGSEHIPTYIENILSFFSDKCNDVKKQVIVFIEELSKLHPDYLPKVIGQLRVLIGDTVIAVQKRAIQAASILYRNTLLWICKSDADITDMQFVWEHLTQLKLIVLNMIDSDNEGIRTHSIKFLEEVVLLQSPGDPSDGDFSLESLSTHVPFINRKALEEESEHIFTLLVKFHNSQHISSVNLMACMTTLCLLAKVRPKYMPRVIQALGDLHTTLPPTLSQSQVNSVRKHLKMLLINLIKHPSSNDMMGHLTQLLLDIGMTNQEINKVIPKDKRNKRLGDVKFSDIPTKRLRIDSPQSNSQGSDSNSRSDMTFDDDSSSQSAYIPTAIPKPEVSEDTIFEGLNSVECVVNLVTNTLANCLPSDMPGHFMTSYKAIPNSGTKVHKRTLAKMIIGLIKNEDEELPVEPTPPVVQPQITPQPQPVLPQPAPQSVPQPVPQPSLSDLAAKIPLLRDDEEEKLTLKNAVAKLQETTKERQIENAVSKLMEETRQEHLKEEERKAKEKEKLVIPSTPTIPKLKQKVKLLKLQEITRPIPKDIKEKLILQAITRILNAEKESEIGGAAHIRSKLITIFASSYTPDIRDLVLNYILDDPAHRIDLAMAWLYEEYAITQGFNRHPVTLQPKMNEKHDQNYNQLLCALVTQICERGDPVSEAAKDMFLRKVYLESPTVTEEAIDYLKHLISEEKMALLPLEILEELCIMRPPRSHKYVPALVSSVLSHNDEVRDIALKASLKIYQKSTDSTRKAIEKHALLYLGFIALGSPPSELLGQRSAYRVPWSDNLYKLCLNLVMTLFPENEELLVEVGRVYGSAGAEAKRVVLRCVEGPLRTMLAEHAARAGPAALPPALDALLDQCPRGAETLLTRIIHILTEKAPPSPELVSKVRELYATRVSDVRFLIPVLTGLSKREILAALPKLIKLNPMVVKEVFNKLLGLHGQSEDQSPVSPTELLVALHLIDPSQAELKFIIKATALCFAEKQTYTQDVVSAVLQNLTEEPEIPVLMMRSVLQALTLYPALGSLTLNILQMLVEKEVWTHKVAWEGWVKCCERLVPTSLSLVSSLPRAALALAMQAPTLRAALAQNAHALPHHVQLMLAQSEPQYTPAPLPVPPPQGMNPLEPLPPGME